MLPTIEQITREFEADLKKVRRKTNTPAKARAFLVKAGILVRHRKSPNGVRLAKDIGSNWVMDMMPSIEQIVRKFEADSKKLLRENNTPAKRGAVLLRAGILVKHRKSPHGVRLAKNYR